MANLRAVDSLVQSVARWLSNAYDTARRPADQGGDGQDFLPAFRFDPVSSAEFARHEFAADATPGAERVAVYLYRVSIDPHLRLSGRPQAPEMQPTPLSLDLHLLFSFWSETASHDHLVVAWLMRQFHLHPVLDAAALNSDAAWGPDEVVHFIPEELSNEDMMRLWDALTPAYRLSVSYIARVVRIDPDRTETALPVVASRFRFGSLKNGVGA